MTDVERTRIVADEIEESAAFRGTTLSKWLRQIEAQRETSTDPKFGADHGWRHVMRVLNLGKDFLAQCNKLTFPAKTPRTASEKEIQMFRIAAMLHDIGLAETTEHHAMKSAEMAFSYLREHGYLLQMEIDEIVHAIFNHSSGQVTFTMLDAALVLGDKLDVARERIIMPNDEIAAALLKIEHVEYSILANKHHEAIGAELRYDVEPDFNLAALAKWQKAVSIPCMITKDFLGLPFFRFSLNGEEVDYGNIIG